MNYGSVPTILVAESDDDARLLLKSLLELKGFRVLEAINGQEAIDMALRKQPDLALIQLKLPVVSGFSVIRRMKKHGELHDVPIIAISTNSLATNHNLALAAGCHAHVENTIEFCHLEELIDRLVPGHRLPLASVFIQ